MDASTGDVLWRFQTGFPSQSGTITYMIDGVQYIATASDGRQPAVLADAERRRGLGVQARRQRESTRRARGRIRSSCRAAPRPRRLGPFPGVARWTTPPAPAFRPTPSTWRARTARPRRPRTATATGSMVPSTLTVPVGTTVTFTNPGDATFGVAGSGNLLEHCATQFFEGCSTSGCNPASRRSTRSTGRASISTTTARIRVRAARWSSRWQRKTCRVRSSSFRQHSTCARRRVCSRAFRVWSRRRSRSLPATRSTATYSC